VAKTTNAVAVAECLADSGYRTLLIDADHQCMSGELPLGEERLLKLDHKRKTLHDLLAAMLDDEFSVEQIPYYVEGRASDISGGLPNLSVIPCSVRIDDFSTNMAKAKRGYHSNDEFLAFFRRRRDSLRKWLGLNFDFTVVDCPPSIALQVRVFQGCPIFRQEARGQAGRASFVLLIGRGGRSGDEEVETAAPRNHSAGTQEVLIADRQSRSRSGPGRFCGIGSASKSRATGARVGGAAGGEELTEVDREVIEALAGFRDALRDRVPWRPGTPSARSSRSSHRLRSPPRTCDGSGPGSPARARGRQGVKDGGQALAVGERAVALDH
jgi:hypothetical protein